MKRAKSISPGPPKQFAPATSAAPVSPGDPSRKRIAGLIRTAAPSVIAIDSDDSDSEEEQAMNTSGLPFLVHQTKFLEVNPDHSTQQLICRDERQRTNVCYDQGFSGCF